MSDRPMFRVACEVCGRQVWTQADGMTLRRHRVPKTTHTAIPTPYCNGGRQISKAAKELRRQLR